ncbi:MAG TPA: hypothetical protein VNM35_00580 [Chitinophagaceae bacterium]|jgi:hypothetical protein|nr:hypothetical protein [Chitinophagaceae bacterium]
MVNLDTPAAGDESIFINGAIIFLYGEMNKKYFFYDFFICGAIQCMNGSKEAT